MARIHISQNIMKVPKAMEMLTIGIGNHFLTNHSHYFAFRFLKESHYFQQLVFLMKILLQFHKEKHEHVHPHFLFYILLTTKPPTQDMLDDIYKSIETNRINLTMPPLTHYIVVNLILMQSYRPFSSFFSTWDMP